MRSTILFLSLVAVGPAPVEVESKITGVTVYPDRALVTRRAEFAAPAGTSTLIFKDLPAAVLNDSVRAKVSGNDQATLRGVEIQTYQIEQVIGDALKKARNEQVEIQDRIRVVWNERGGTLPDEFEEVHRVREARTQQGADHFLPLVRNCFKSSLYRLILR